MISGKITNFVFFFGSEMAGEMGDVWRWHREKKNMAAVAPAYRFVMGMLFTFWPGGAMSGAAPDLVWIFPDGSSHETENGE